MVRWINFYRGYAPGSGQAVYTLNTRIWPYAAIRAINMTNPTSSGVTVKVWVIPSGWAGPIDQFLIVPGWYLPPKNTVTGDAAVSQWTGFEVLTKDGDEIWLEASVDNVVSVSINGGGSK